VSFLFIRAQEKDVPDIYNLISSRVKWMDDNNIKQWNVTDYLNVYPVSYYQEHQRCGRLYKMIEADSGRILGVMVLLDIDARWPGYEEMDSFFVHNFATTPDIKGIGRLMLEEAEKLSREYGKKYLRLDCPSHSLILNNYYESKAYVCVGTCVDGLYSGNLREKRL